jgi:RNA polymerase sigma-70 factor (ECF subfamily)
VVVQGDGGGNAPQWSQPIDGPDRVARLLGGVGRQIGEFGLRLERREVNGQPGAILRTPGNEVVSIFVLEIGDDERIRAVRSVINPEKLRHLGPVADVWGMVRERAARGRTPG